MPLLLLRIRETEAIKHIADKYDFHVVTGANDCRTLANRASPRSDLSVVCVIHATKVFNTFESVDRL